MPYRHWWTHAQKRPAPAQHNKRKRTLADRTPHHTCVRGAGDHLYPYGKTTRKSPKTATNWHASCTTYGDSPRPAAADGKLARRPADKGRGPDLFSLGLLDLRTRAQIEKLFWSIAREVGDMASSMKHAPEELRKITKMIPDKYFCNFSLFQSLPDTWAIDQIFPIMPISRLDEKPSRTCTIQDITCDSDGKISGFITSHGTSSSLPVAHGEARRAVLHRRVPRRRIPGNTRRHAQPLRRHQRRTHKRIQGPL